MDHCYRQLTSQSWGAENSSFEAGIGSVGRLEAATSFSSAGSRRAYVSTAYGQPFPVTRNTRTHLQTP